MSALVQRQYPRLGDRLLGIVELADERTRPGNVSAARCRAAIRQVSAETAPMDFRMAVATRKPRIYALTATFLILLALLPWLLAPEAGWNALARWMWPGSAVKRFTFAGLETFPDRLIVAHGEPFQIGFGVRLHPFWKPGWATGRMEGQPDLRAPILAGRVVFEVPGQTRETALWVRVGDVVRPLAIEPMLRPALKGMRMRIRYPGYLGYDEGEAAIVRGVCSFVEDSRVAFHGTATRPLGSASVTLTAADGTALEGVATVRRSTHKWAGPVGKSRSPRFRQWTETSGSLTVGGTPLMY
jgi:hypothetical protein